MVSLRICGARQKRARRTGIQSALRWHDRATLAQRIKFKSFSSTSRPRSSPALDAGNVGKPSIVATTLPASANAATPAAT
jgi:hypothetical protein